MTLKCSAEPKCRDVAQIAVFEAKPVPLWLKDKMRPKGQESGFRYRAAQRTLKSRYLTAAFLYALRGASHDITSRDFVCHRSPNHSRNRLTLWGHSPQSPERRDVYGERCSYCRKSYGKGKEKIQAKARKCGLNTTEYVKQRALGYEPRAVPPDALFACLEKLGELADKASSPELVEEIGAVLKQITAEFLLPGKG